MNREQGNTLTGTMRDPSLPGPGRLDAGVLASARGPLVLQILLLAAVALLLVSFRSRGIDPDEFEHLHAGYMLWRGELPYRDFFEHHGPALYYAIQPLFDLCGPDLVVLRCARGVMLFCSLATLWCTRSIGRRLGGEMAGWIAAALLAWTTIFQSKGIELRPDVPAALLLTIALNMSLWPAGGRASFLRWVAIGMLCAAATLFTQKSIVPAVGLGLAAAFRAWREEGLRPTVQILAVMAACGAAAWAAAIAWFAQFDAADEFVHSTIVRLLTWPVRSHAWEQLRPTLVADTTIWLAAAIEVVSLARPSARNDAAWPQRLQVAVAWLFSVLALAWVKATYAQFYFLWFPLAAALAARRFDAWSRTGGDWRVFLVAALGVMAAGVAQVALSFRAMRLGEAGALVRIEAWLRSASIDPRLVPLAVASAAVVMLFIVLRRRNWRELLGLLAGLGMVYGTLRNVDTAIWSNQEQVARVNSVYRHVGPNETVLDGFTGYGVLRPHAWYYWWINEYSLALLSETDRGPGLLARLEEAPPRAVLLDENLRRLPAVVVDWIVEHYSPSKAPPIWLRNRDE